MTESRPLRFVSAAEVHAALEFPPLIEALREQLGLELHKSL